MAGELVNIQTPRALRANDGSFSNIKDVIATNIDGGGINELDLPRAKISGGSNPCWVKSGLGGEETTDRIDGVPVYARTTRSYYRIPYGKSGGKQPPDCSSLDGVTGQGKPGGECCRCPMAEYGSAEDGPGQACKEVKQLFVLYDDILIPELVSLPPTSLKNIRQFMLKLTIQGIPYHHALISLGLEKAQNAASIQYGRVVPKFIRRLTPEEAVRAQEYHELFKGWASRVPAGFDSEAREHSSE